FYNPFEEDERDESTIVELLYPVEPPVYCEFDWEFDEVEAPDNTVMLKTSFINRVAEQQEVACLMLVSMTLEIQKNLEDRIAFEILQEPKTMFQQHAEQELFETVKAFHACKQKDCQSVSTYVLKMKGYLDQMERPGYPMPLVFGKLKSQARGKGKQRDNGKSKLAYDPGHKIPPPAKKEHPTKDTECIFTVELFLFPKSNSWIYDTGYGIHICNTIQGLRGYQKLNKRALDLYVGNGNTAAVEAIGSYEIILPSGMILDNIYYFNAFPCDGIFKIDMHDHISNECSIYTCSNKKSKHNLDSTFLWHSQLGHINKKRIENLQHDWLFMSIVDEYFDVCVSCISGKMERKPFAYASESGDDLLGIIHSDACGPFRTTSREGANYYVTFTYDFNRYGYVYLIKHKHEVLKCSRLSKTK
nr:zinc finger, CCHC-type [Tanacetum cinerariifolium]